MWFYFYKIFKVWIDKFMAFLNENLYSLLLDYYHLPLKMGSAKAGNLTVAVKAKLLPLPALCLISKYSSSLLKSP